MAIFSCVSYYNDKKYRNILFPEYKMWFLLGFCCISLIRKHKQCLRRTLTFNNSNTFLVDITIFKVKKKNIGTRCEICSTLTIKRPERRQFVFSIFNSKHILRLVLVLLKLTLNKQMLVAVITGWWLATLLNLALLFRYYLGFLTRLMVLKLRNKSHKCRILNFLVFYVLRTWSYCHSTLPVSLPT